jgi:hypothetical protein
VSGFEWFAGMYASRLKERLYTKTKIEGNAFGSRDAKTANRFKQPPTPSTPPCECGRCTHWIILTRREERKAFCRPPRPNSDSV